MPLTKLSRLGAAVLLSMASLRAQVPDTAHFRNGIDLVNITATITDKDGHFVTDLRQEDFLVYEDGKPQAISQFTRQRVPVSLGILLDDSGSMTGDRLKAAQAAIRHLVSGLLDEDDELFFMQFGFSAMVTQEWTADRRLIRSAVDEVSAPTGDTALYDAIALALPTAQEGHHAKKALLVISDGHDTRSVITLHELQQSILESEVLVYALGIDHPARNGSDERAHMEALRQITDDTGGRTEVVHGVVHLDAAISRIADELRQQFVLGYSSNLPKDGRWHSIRVEVRDRRLKVRARRGYIAS